MMKMMEEQQPLMKMLCNGEEKYFRGWTTLQTMPYWEKLLMIWLQLELCVLTGRDWRWTKYLVWEVLEKRVFGAHISSLIVKFSRLEFKAHYKTGSFLETKPIDILLLKLCGLKNELSTPEFIDVCKRSLFSILVNFAVMKWIWNM